VTLQCRTTIVNSLFVNSVGTASMLQLGDNDVTDAENKVLAVAQAIPNYSEDEFRFASYPLFFLPELKFKKPCVPVVMNSSSPCPEIRVGFIYVLALASSSVMRAGCNGPLKGLSRIKHIRYFNNRTSPIESK